MTWPTVEDEFKTIRKVAAGNSIARFGDGEFKIILGKGYSREPPNSALSAELRKVLESRIPGLLIGIPTLDPAGPKIESWRRHELRFGQLVNGKDYVSAFITRPDSAPWIMSRKYIDIVLSIWAGKCVSVICEDDSKIPHVVKTSAAHVLRIKCPSHRAYARIREFELAVVRNGSAIAVLSCGPTATCLAKRLHRRGIQAIDLGSSGGFLCKLLAAR